MPQRISPIQTYTHTGTAGHKEMLNIVSFRFVSFRFVHSKEMSKTLSHLLTVWVWMTVCACVCIMWCCVKSVSKSNQNTHSHTRRDKDKDKQRQTSKILALLPAEKKKRKEQGDARRWELEQVCVWHFMSAQMYATIN